MKYILYFPENKIFLGKEDQEVLTPSQAKLCTKEEADEWEEEGYTFLRIPVEEE